jgi:hypothetical protein
MRIAAIQETKNFKRRMQTKTSFSFFVLDILPMKKVLPESKHKTNF